MKTYYVLNGGELTGPFSDAATALEKTGEKGPVIEVAVGVSVIPTPPAPQTLPFWAEYADDAGETDTGSFADADAVIKWCVDMLHPGDLATVEKTIRGKLDHLPNSKSVEYNLDNGRLYIGRI